MSSRKKAGPAKPTVSPRPTGGRVWLFKLVLAVGMPLLLCLLLEGGLRLFGFGRSPDFFIPDTKPGFYRTNPRFTENFFPASFGLKPLNFRLSKKKPAGTIRVFLLGESAAMGVPEPAFALAPQLQAQLRAIHPGARIDVFNLGVTAINSHAILPVLRQTLDFEPDLLVVYMGNNEAVGPYGSNSIITRQPLPIPLIRISVWVRGTRTGQLLQRAMEMLAGAGRNFRDWRGMEMFAGKAVAADDASVRKVHENFSANLRSMVASAEAAGVKLVLSTVAVNVRDCAPFVSLSTAGLTEAQSRTWAAAWEEGRKAEAARDIPHAVEALGQAAAIDPHHAATQYLLAASLEAQSDSLAARPHFFSALEQDGLRFRADSAINSLIRQMAGEAPGKVFLTDVARELGADPTAASRVPGSDLFFEHVHLTWEGNYAVSRLLAATAADALFGPSPEPRRWLSAAACADAVGYTEFGHYSMLQSMDKLTGRPPFTGQVRFAADRIRIARQLAACEAVLGAPGALPNMAARIDRALKDDPENPLLLFQAALADFQAGDKEAALRLLDRLAEARPFSPEDAILRSLVLQALDRSPEAEPLLRRAVAEEPFYLQTYGLLAQIWSKTGRTEKALNFLAGVINRMPDSRALRITNAQLLAINDDWRAIETQWRAVLSRTPDDEAVLGPLLKRLATTGRIKEAVELMHAAYAYNPRSFANNKRLVEYSEARKETGQEVKYREDLAASGAVSVSFFQELAQKYQVLGQPREWRWALLRARNLAIDTGDSAAAAEIDRLLPN